MAWIAGIVSVILLTYSLLIFYYLTGIRKLRAQEYQEDGGRLSLIIPFRNETTFLRKLIDSLKAQDYPGENYQVLLINDHSTDGSAQLARSLTTDDSRFTVLDLPENMEGKKAAVALAVEHAEHQWILQTDADCRFGKEFIRTHMSGVRAGSADLVAGMVIADCADGGFRAAFECLDLLALSGVAAGSFARGRPLMCSAANLRYRKKLYLDTRTYDPEEKIPSGDDMFLMIGARKLKRPSTFNTDPGSLVLTAPAKNTMELFRQRIRWGGKTPVYGLPGIQLVALLVVLAAAGTLLFPIWILSVPVAWWIPLVAPACKILADLALLYRMTGLTGQRRVLRWFLPAWLIYQPFLLIVALASLVAGTSWKNRSVSARPR